MSAVNRRIRKACERRNDAQFTWHRAQSAVRYARYELYRELSIDGAQNVCVVVVAGYDLDAGAYWEWFERELDAQDGIN